MAAYAALGFLLGAGSLGVSATDTVVFEDAPVGIEAARAAGMRVVALTTTHAARDLADADLVVERLTPMLLGQVRALVSG